VDWVHLAEDSVQWQAVVKKVMNNRIPKMLGIYLES
jgi:hypothetical protein